MKKLAIVIISWLLFFFLAKWLPFHLTSNQYEGYLFMVLTLIGGTSIGIVLTLIFLFVNKNRQ